MARITEVTVSYNCKLNKDYNSAGMSVGYTAEVPKGESADKVELTLRKKCKKRLNTEAKKLAAFLNAASSL